MKIWDALKLAKEEGKKVRPIGGESYFIYDEVENNFRWESGLVFYLGGMSDREFEVFDDEEFYWSWRTITDNPGFILSKLLTKSEAEGKLFIFNEKLQINDGPWIRKGGRFYKHETWQQF